MPPACTVLSPLSWPNPEREPWGILTPAWLWMEQLSSGHLLPVGRWMWLLKNKPDVSSVLQMKVCSLIHYEAKNRVYKCFSSWMVSRNTCSPGNVKMDIFGWQITSERSVLLSPLYHSLSFFFWHSGSSKACFLYTCAWASGKGHTACGQVCSKRPSHLHLAQA